MGKSQFDIIIQETDVASLGKELLEVSIDAFTDDEFIKSLPVVSTILAPFKFYNSINKYFFAKKITKFLKELDQTTPEQRKKVVDKIDKSGEFENTVGETVFEILERVDSEKKPQILGKLYRAFITENISYKDFLKLSHIVKNCLISDLFDFKAKVRDGYVYGEVADELMIFGLYSPDLVGGYNDSKDGNRKESYSELNTLGTLLIQYGF